MKIVEQETAMLTSRKNSLVHLSYTFFQVLGKVLTSKGLGWGSE